MAERTAHDTDIAVAGGGIAGLTLALALAGSPHSVTVLTRGEGPEQSMGHILSPAACALLPELALADAPGSDDYPAAPITRYDFLHPHRGELASIDLSALGGPVQGALGMDRHKLLSLLHSRIAGSDNIQIIEEADVTGLLRSTGRCTGLRAEKGGMVVDVRASLTVLADGSRSRLRRLAGFDEQKFGPRHRWLVLDIPAPEELGHRFVAYMSALGFASILPLPEGRARAALLTNRGQLRSWADWELLRWRREVALRAPLLLRAPMTLGDGHVHIVQPGGVDTYHRPGVCLLGDAAHTIHPVLSHGIELALFDGLLLGRILAETDLDADGEVHDKLQQYETVSRTLIKRVRRGTREFRNLMADSRLSRFITFVILPRWNRLGGFDRRFARRMALTPAALPGNLTRAAVERRAAAGRAEDHGLDRQEQPTDL